MTEHLPILIIAIPLVAAFLTPVIGMLGNNVRNFFTLAVILVANVLIYMLAIKLLQNGGPIYYVLGASDPTQLIPNGLGFPIRIALKIDALAVFMSMIAGLVAFVAHLYSWKFTEKDSYQNYYYVLLKLMLVGVLGLVYTNDLFNFFVFLEILSISSAALVAFRTKQKHPSYAGYKYLLISAVATSIYLIGIAMIYAQYGSFNIDYLMTVIQNTSLDKIALVFILAPLAMKAGAVPMHMWVPDTYSEAPAPITMMLIVATQASLYGIIRLLFNLFNIGSFGVMMDYGYTIGWMIVVVGVITIVVGVSMAMIQKDIKRLMAFSALSQIGYILMGLGVGIIGRGNCLEGSLEICSFGKTAMIGSVFHILNDVLFKGLLFLTAGIMYLRFGTRNLNRMQGLAHRDTFTTVIFIIAALAAAGIPPFNGFASKILLYESVFIISPIVAMIAVFASILTLAMFTKIFYGAFLGPRRDDLIVNNEKIGFGMRLGMTILCILIILIGLFPNFVTETIIEPAVMGLFSI